MCRFPFFYAVNNFNAHCVILKKFVTPFLIGNVKGNHSSADTVKHTVFIAFKGRIFHSRYVITQETRFVFAMGDFSFLVGHRKFQCFR